LLFRALEAAAPAGMTDSFVVALQVVGSGGISKGAIFAQLPLTMLGRWCDT